MTWATPSGWPDMCVESLSDDGTWLVVEPLAGDTVADNLTPVGRMYYSFSTFLCVPTDCPNRGYGAGRTGGEAASARTRPLDAGFTRFRQAARDPVQPGVRGPSGAG